jgi:hypothetical protein
VTTDLILGMVSEDGKTAPRAYREYVAKGVDEGGRNPLEDELTVLDLYEVRN